MYLTRDVRFSINPFLAEQVQGNNPYACKPSGQGLSIFLELGVTLNGLVSKDTGFVVNVCDIDQCVRKHIVPVFTDRICNQYSRHKDLSYHDLSNLLRISKDLVAHCFGPDRLQRLTLKLNPYKNLAISCQGIVMFFLSEKFEFAAMHKLWNTTFSERQNEAVFGKCANPTGHGHNYIIEITLKTDEASNIDSIEFERTISTYLIDELDHKNLNEDVPYFQRHNPTMENIAHYAWDQLSTHMKSDTLYCITVWESDRTQCRFYGPNSIDIQETVI